MEAMAPEGLVVLPAQLEQARMQRLDQVQAGQAPVEQQ